MRTQIESRSHGRVRSEGTHVAGARARKIAEAEARMVGRAAEEHRQRPLTAGLDISAAAIDRLLADRGA